MSNTAGRLTGGPAWIGSSNASYDIEATIPKDTIPAGTSYSAARQKLLPMVQNLLRDRFHLQVHRDVAEMPVYSVTLAKSGPLLQKATIEERDCPGPETPASASVSCHKLAGGRGRGIRGFAVTLNDFFQYLEPWIDRPLVDDTGLTGLFNIQTSAWREFHPEDPNDPNANITAATNPAAADLPMLPEVFEKLGFKIKAQKGRAAVIVIDAIQRPSENYEQMITVNSQTSTVMLNLPVKMASLSISGTVSVGQLLHPIDKKALKSFKASQDFIEKGDFERAARQLERAIEVSPGYADAYGSLAAVHIKMGRYVQALTEISQAIGVAGPNARDLSNQALAYYDLEDYAASIKAARWALRLDPNYDPAHFVLGATLAIDKRTMAESVPHLERAARTIISAKAILAIVQKAMSHD